MVRLDIELIRRELLKTRSQATLSIKEGNVMLNGIVCQRPSKDIKDIDVLTVKNIPKYVSRGGDKLEYALKTFGIKNVKGKVALDIGSSTGGFTDCLLQSGVSKVYSVDVGTDQLDQVLKNDHRVVSMEKSDIRYLESLPEQIDIVVIDVSFISLAHIVPVLPRFLVKGGSVVALVKPQFEVGKNNLNRQGLVKDSRLYQDVTAKVQDYFLSSNFEVIDVTRSPVIGGSGNIEFLLFAKYGKNNL